MKEKEEWPQTINNWFKISKDTMNVGISESKSLLSETISAAQSIQDKSDKLIAIIIPIFTAIVVFFATEKKDTSILLNLICVFLALTTILCFYYLFPNIKTYEINPNGIRPTIFIDDSVLDLKQPDEEQFIRIGLQICREYLFRIDKNKEANFKRSSRYEKAIKVMVIGIPLSPLLAITVTFFRHHCPL